MHNRAKVIFPDEVGHKVTLHIKVMSSVLLNVVIVDGDVLVSVPAGVLVPEPNSVHQLMDHTEQKICNEV